MTNTSAIADDQAYCWSFTPEGLLGGQETLAIQ
jgi:hypothetical protein